jgi:hypothetical protein
MGASWGRYRCRIANHSPYPLSCSRPPALPFRHWCRYGYWCECRGRIRRPNWLDGKQGSCSLSPCCPDCLRLLRRHPRGREIGLTIGSDQFGPVHSGKFIPALPTRGALTLLKELYGAIPRKCLLTPALFVFAHRHLFVSTVFQDLAVTGHCDGLRVVRTFRNRQWV